MKNYSDLTKFLKKLRVDFDYTQTDIAKILNVSTSFYSSIELGDKPIPVSIRDKIIDHFKLNDNDIKQFDFLIFSNIKELTFSNFKSLNLDDRYLIYSILTKFNTLSEDIKSEINRLLTN